MTKAIVTFSIIPTLIASYIYLDWGIMQLLGICFVIACIDSINEKRPVLQRVFWDLLALSLMVLGHFVIDDKFMDWGAILLSAILFFTSIALLYGLLNSKSGDGSVLTVYFLGIIIIFPLAIFILYQAMTGLGYW